MSTAPSWPGLRTIAIWLYAAGVTSAAAGCAKQGRPPMDRAVAREAIEYSTADEYDRQLKVAQRTGISGWDPDRVDGRRRWRPLFWNSWMVMDTDPASPEPVRALEPGRAYKLHVDLAGIDYRAVLAKRDPLAAAVAPA